MVNQNRNLFNIFVKNIPIQAFLVFKELLGKGVKILQRATRDGLIFHLNYPHELFRTIKDTVQEYVA